MASGISVDIFGPSLAVVMVQAGWGVEHKDTIVNALKETTGINDVRVRVGWDRVNKDHGGEGLKEGWIEDEDEGEEDGTSFTIMENGVKYLYNPGETQKTGFYTDQRDNRSLLSTLCGGKSVLDLCCYVGSFSLNAVVNGGARNSTGVDSSAKAVGLAADNAQVNGVEGKCTFLKDDVGKFMKRMREEGESWDVIVLDPPKLGK